MIKDIKRARNERGFTLIELLVVIVILGILAAVVVFAVGGLGDRGQGNACKVDEKTLKTAEEAHYAAGNLSLYATEDKLLADDLIEAVSELHDITITDTAGHGPSYEVAPVTNGKCDT